MSRDLTKPGNYKAYNILHKIRTWKLRGQDPRFLFEGIDLDYRELAETDWLDFLSQVRKIWDNELKKLPNPREQEALGYDVYRNESMGALEVLGKLLSLRSIFAQFVRLSKQYSLIEDYSVHNLRRNSVVLIYTPKKEFYEFFGFENPSFAKGFLKAMPKIYEPSYAKEGERIPDARVEMVMNWVSLETVLLKNYAFLTTGMDIEIVDDGLYVDKKLFAKKIFLAVEEEAVTPLTRMVDFLIGKGKTKPRLLYAGKEGEKLVTIDNPLGKDGTGYLVLEDLVIGDTLVLRKGEIFDAPYCRFDISWSNTPYRVRVKYALRDLSTAMRSSRQKLLEQLEIADERYFNEIKARQRAERAEQEVKEANEKLRIAHKKLQDYAEHLEDLVEERTAQLMEEEKTRRIYQVRAAQADAVARFLHQTSNLVLQPLASMMIVFEDFIEIVEDCRTEWEQHQSDEVLFQELDEGLARVQEVYPSASRVIEGYRRLFQAFYEVYVSTESQRDVNQDLRYIEALVRNKYILTQVELGLELDAAVPPLSLEGGVQSIFLELMHNAARHGAKRLLVETAYDSEEEMVRLFFYNDGEPISEEQWGEVMDREVSEEGRGFGLVDARYIVETLNGGRLRLEPSDREDFSVLFGIDLKIGKCEDVIEQERGERDE